MNARLASLILAVALTPAAVAQSSDQDRRDPFRGLQQELDAVQWRHTSKSTGLSRGDAVQFAARLNQRSGIQLVHLPERDEQDRMVFQDPSDASSILDVDLRAGAFHFNAGMNGLRGEGDTPNLPQDSRQARRRAFQHLRQLGLLPEREELVLVHEGGLNMAEHREDGSTEIFRKLVTLRLGRKTEGLLAEGPGSRIVIHLGEGGSLHGLTYHWEPVVSEPLAPQEKMTAMEIRRLARIKEQTVGQSALKRFIDTVEVVEYDDGFGVREPAVRVVVRMIFQDPDGSTFANPADFYIPIPRDPKAYYPFMEDQGIPAPSEEG